MIAALGQQVDMNTLLAAAGRGRIGVRPAVGPGKSNASGKPNEVNATQATESPDGIGKTELTEEEKKQVEELKQRDTEVKRHEQAHKAAAGSHARGGPQYEYTTGPDGRRYAVGGEVSIDTSAVDGDPQATIAKMQQIRRAASAPADPSSQDRQVAAQAAAQEQQARQEIASEGQGAGLPHNASADKVRGYDDTGSTPGRFIDVQI